MIANNRCVIVFALLMIFAGAVFAGADSAGRNAYSLVDCITKALDNHPKLGVYQQKTKQQKENLRAVSAGNLPQVDAVAGYDRFSYLSQAKQRSSGGSYDDYQADIVVTQPLFSGGKITSEKQAVRRSFEAAELDFFVAREEVIYNVKSAYYKLVFAQDLVKSKAELLEYAQSSYDTAFDLHKRAKEPRKEELLRLKVQLNEIRQELIAAQESLTVAKKTLLNAMGLDTDGFVKIQSLREDIFFTESLPVKTADNYAILEISEKIKGAAELIKTAKSAFYPQLDARYSYGYQWGEFSEPGDPDWIAGVAVNFNIWDWGKTKAEVRQAQAYKQELESYKNLLSQQLDLEIESAQLKYESALTRFEIARTSLEQAKESLDIYEKRYQDTLATSVEFLDAQKAFSQAQVNYLRAKLDMRLAKAEIVKIAGKGHEYQ
jgi:outer membrane protein